MLSWFTNVFTGSSPSDTPPENTPVPVTVPLPAENVSATVTQEIPSLIASAEIVADNSTPPVLDPISPVKEPHIELPKWPTDRVLKSTVPDDIANSFTNLSISNDEPIAKNPLKIVILLDESGSMESNRRETINAINDFIHTQKNTKANDDCTFTLITFDHSYRVVFKDILLDRVQNLDSDNYRPSGCTALYDAIGITIESISEARNVVFVILTDGKENSSRKYSRTAIGSLINKYKGVWNIIYLSADPMLTEQGNDINIVHETDSGTSNCYTNFQTLSSYTRSHLGKAVSEFRQGVCSTVRL